jgi:hypothetical protein
MRRWYMSMEQWWNDVYWREPKNSEKNVSQCHFIHHKSHKEWPASELEIPMWEGSDQPLEPRHGHTKSTPIMDMELT